MPTGPTAPSEPRPVPGHVAPAAPKWFGLAGKLGTLLAGFLLLSLANLFAFHTLLSGLRTLTPTVDVAHRLSVLVLKMSLASVSQQLRPPPPECDIAKTIAEFDRLLATLADGGVLGTLTVAPVPESARALLDRIRTMSASYRAVVRSVGQHSPGSATFESTLRTVHAADDPLLERCEELVSTLTAEAIAQQNAVQVWVWRLAALDLFLIVIGFLVVWLSIIVPLRRLREAALALARGDLTTMGPADRGDEIGELSGILHQLVGSAFTALEAARSAEGRYRGLVQGIVSIVWELDAETLQSLFVSDQVQAVLGAWPGDVQAAPEAWFEHVHPDDRAPFMEAVRAAARGAKALDVEVRAIRRDGQAIWLRCAGARIEKGANGRPCLVGTATEITVWKRAAEALRTSQLLIDGIINAIPVRVFWKDRNLVYLGCNAAFARDAGFSEPKDIIGKCDHDMAWREHAELYRGDDRAVIDSGCPKLLIEEPLTTPEGHGTLLTSKVPLRDFRGEICGVLGTYLDITERKQAEATHARLATAVEQGAEAIAITDAAGAIQYVNPAFERVSGYTRAEVIGQNPRVLKSGAQAPEFYERMWGALTRGEVWRGHIINRRKDGTLYELDATISPVHDGARRVVSYVSVGRDVTREVQLEARFRQSQRMEAFGQLAGGVAHDFNNILMVILGYTSMVLDELPPGAPHREMLETVHRSGQRAAGLTRQLLAFSRQQLLNPKVLDLNVLVRDMEKMLRRLVREDISITTILGPDLGRMKADPGQIEQVLLNLVVNASDAMPDGGEITIQTANVTLDGESAESLPALRPGPHQVLTVTDTGIGMNGETRLRIFEPFFTTKGPGKGTGLGLSTVLGIVSQSGGAIAVFSSPGHGSRFQVYFPQVDEAPSLALAGAPATPEPDTPRVVLVVEDQEEVRDLACRILRRVGHVALGADGPAEARRVADTHAGPIHVILTDVVMPGGNGRDLARELAARLPEVRVIFMSGYASDEILHHGVLETGVPFLEKPFTATDLKRLMAEVLSRPRVPVP